MGVFLLRGILYVIYPRIASRIPNKREILRLSRRIVRATWNFPVPRNRAKLHVYFAKADYYCLKANT